MKKLSLAAAALFAAIFLYGQEKVRFMPAWIPQAQFAGFYMAQEKGFYADEGLDVEISNLSISSSVNPLEELSAGNIDICTSQLVQGTISRSKGNPILNILQIAQNSSLVCVSHTPIKNLSDLDGLRIARWKSGHGEHADMACREFGVQPKWEYTLTGINLFISRAVDAMIAYRFSEYLQLLFAKGRIPSENVIDFGDFGFNFPEDAVFTSETFYNEHKDAVDKFVRASIRGWQYAAAHRDETVDVVMRYALDNHNNTNHAMQKMMLDEILDIQVDKDSGKATFGHVDVESFDQMNEELSAIGLIENPVNYKDFIK